MSEDGNGTKVVQNSAVPGRVPNPGDFRDGHPKIGGRKKGTPNRFTSDIRDALIEAVNRVGRDGEGDEGMVGYLMASAMSQRQSILAMLNKAMPSLVNVKETEHAKFLNYAEARERLLSSGVPAAILDHMHGYTPGDVEKMQREAEEEAARRREALMSGDVVEGTYEEIVE
jgi:hypothetical protein